MENEQKPKRKVLIIDDDPVMVKILTSRLGSHGFDVIAAEDAATGLELAIKKAPDVIVLDVMMPIINGYNICRLLKTEERLTIPIIMLTNRIAEEDKQIGKEVGADAYLFKPLNIDDLLKTIKEFIKDK